MNFHQRREPGHPIYLLGVGIVADGSIALIFTYRHPDVLLKNDLGEGASVREVQLEGIRLYEVAQAPTKMWQNMI